jgi:hypothetical protein
MQNIQAIIDSFKVEYNSTPPKTRDSTLGKFNKKIYDYLSYHFLDSIRVRVDTVIVDGWTVTTKFHFNPNIAFQYGLTFKKGMDAHFDTLFRFMKGLPIGVDTTVTFTYMAAHLLNPHPNPLSPTLTLYAIPSPIFWKNH